MMRALAVIAAAIAVFAMPITPAEARSCKQLRALCWTMRANDNDCAKPYLQCRKTGTFVTPLGRRFKATTR